MATRIPVMLTSIAAVGVILLIGIGGWNMEQPAQLVEVRDVAVSNTEPAASAITPQRFQASQHTGKVASQDFEAAGSATRSEWEAPDLLPDADASHGPSKMKVRQWYVPDHDMGVAFDSDGNLFSHGEYEVSRINVSSRQQTIWTMPEGWESDGLFSTVDSSGYYYFTANHKLVKLDHDTGVFTMWDIMPKGMHWARDGIYFIPRDTVYMSSDLDLNVTQVSLGTLGRISGEGASGKVKVEVTLPSGDVHVAHAHASSYARFDAYLEVFTDADLSDGKHIGSYTVRASDLVSSSELQFEIEGELGVIWGSDPKASDVDTSILQRLDPNTNTLTTFFTDAQISPSYRTVHLSAMSDGGAFYYHTEGINPGLVEFTPGTGDVRHWPGVPTSLGASAVSDQKVYWGNHVGRGTLKVIELDTAANSVREVTSPHDHRGDFGSAVADSDGDVFFTNHHLYKFEPSANAFKKFNLRLNIAGITSDDTIYAYDWWGDQILRMVPTYDTERPSINILAGAPHNDVTYSSAIPFDLYFSETVSGLDVSDIALLNDTEGIEIRDLFVRPTLRQSSFYAYAPGGANMTIQIPAGAVVDHNHNGNFESTEHTVTIKPLSSISEEDKERWLEQNPTIVVGYNNEWAPFEFENSTGQAAGITARYAELLGEILDADIVTRGYQDYRIPLAIYDGAVDVVLMGVMHERLLNVGIQFTAPHMEVPIHIATIGDRGIDADNLGSHRLLVIEGTAIDRWLDIDNIDLQGRGSHVDAILDMSDGHHDALLAPWPVAEYYAGLSGVTGIHDAGESGYVYDLRVAYRDHSPALGAIMEDAMAKIPETVRDGMLSDAMSPGNGDPSPVITSEAVAGAVVESDRATFTVDFGETVTGFGASDISLDGAVPPEIRSFNVAEYTFDVVATGNGPVTISIPAGAVADLHGNPNTASEDYVVTFDIPDES